MGRSPADQESPEPSSTDGSAATSPKLPVGKAPTETAPQRYVLPKNLRNAVKHLSDGELDLMHAAILEEMKRRGRMPKGIETDLQSLRHRVARSDFMKIQSPATEKRRAVDIAEVSLTQGQVSAVRSAFKAGITPSRIAREFGIPLPDVRKALAYDEKQR